MKYLIGLILFIAMFSFSYTVNSGTIDVIDPDTKEIIKIYDKHDGDYDPKLIPIEWNPFKFQWAFTNHIFLTLEPSQYNKTFFDGFMVVFVKLINKNIALLLSYSYYKDKIYYYFEYNKELDKYKQVNPGGV